MKPETLKAAIAEAKRFIKAAEQCKFVPGCYNKDSFYPESTKSTAATKRASMDLTRMLAATPYFQGFVLWNIVNSIEFGDCRETMRRWAADGVRVQTCITSPPYFGLRDYGHDGQIGLEQTPEEYIAAMVEVFRCVRDVLADDGTLWLNIGDSYAANRAYQVPSTKGGPKHSDSQSAGGKGSKVPDGLKPKDLIGIPWMLAFALRADGWYLRQDIIWHKPNPMPESVRDRCTKAHEYIFLLSKSERYFFDSEAMREPSADPEGSAARYKSAFGGKKNEALLATDQVHTRPIGMREFDGKRNRRSVWTIATRPYKGAHFATFPPALIEPCILAGSRPGDLVLDPFIGSGTTAQVAIEHGRRYLGCELNPEYGPLQQQRIEETLAALQGPPAKPRKLRQPKPVVAAQTSLFAEAAQ